jgi:hypothetical protein
MKTNDPPYEGFGRWAAGFLPGVALYKTDDKR